MYENLIGQWLRDDLTDDARALAIEIIEAVIAKAKEGDMAAVQWLDDKRWLAPFPNLNITFVPNDDAID